MLSLREIVKTYQSGDTTVRALGGVSIDFRKSEFVSILGASGCGKTTLLNVIGGLDRYDSGDLIIDGRSTKEYGDADWDTYRNHSIGFVFQSYNLIMHQTVLSNVELALTLSGVSREERRRRATEALEMVGLGDQLHKKPNQMSGGQMQRVAIARALVNNPEILLADEPTGALDTHTSVQIMDILKEVAKTRLVIMVTHNPDLAKEYSTRIIRLSDGKVVDDSDPFTVPVEKAEEVAAPTAEKPAKKKKKGGKGKRSMSFFTALSLSLNNLLTKKTRTLLVSVAGSIGIIGIALILSLSNGVNLFIASVQEDTLSTYPLTLQRETQDMSALLGAMMATGNGNDYSDSGKIYVDDSLGTMMGAMKSTISNNLVAFKKYIEAHPEKLEGLVNDIQYTYDFDLQIFTGDGKTQVNPTAIFEKMGPAFSGMGELMASSPMGAMGVFSEMINNQTLLDQQYELVGEGSRWPTNEKEVVLVISSNNQISKMALYMLGVLDQDELEDIMNELLKPDGTYDATPIDPYDIEDFLGMSFRLLNTSQFYDRAGTTYTVNGVEYPEWYDMREAGFDQESFVRENGIELKICGVVRPRKGVAATSISGAIGYTKGLTDLILAMNEESEIIHQQKVLTPTHSVLNGDPFERTPYTRENIEDLIDRVGSTNMERFYGIMTDMILQNPDYVGLLEVTPQSVAGFIGTMENELQAEKIGKLLQNAASVAENDPLVAAQLNVLFSVVKSIPGLNSVDFTVDNVVDLLPLLSMEQIAVLVGGIPDTPAEGSTPAIPGIKGLKDLCAPDFMITFYDEMNAEMVNWKLNDKSLALIMGQMDDTMFATLESTLYEMVPDKDETLKSMLKRLGDAEQADPMTINFYAVDFASKEKIEAVIAEYNASVADADKIEYTDLVGTMMSSVTVIVDAISYVLIAFVSISLVVSSIMIGIITYISVLERIKEIGILRAIGASKRDISRVFNAETLIIGFAAGAIGIIFTLLLCIPINLIIHTLSGISNINAILPIGAAFILVGISMALTLIAGLIPSRIASKKDPVVALRTE